MIKQASLVISLIVFFSCSNQTKEEKWESMARSSFHEFVLWEDARMMNAIDFKGPIVRDSIGGFTVDTGVVVYAWYHIHEPDTFWIYCKIDKSNKKKPSIHSSSNFNELELYWEEWIKDK